MKTSGRGRDDIAGHEGVVLKAYRDVAGILTIGVGHTANAGPPVPKAGMTITRAEALAIFARDLGRFEMRVAAALGEVPQHVFDGAVSFDYNTGAIHRASWVRSYRRGDMAAAERQLMLWNKAGGRVVKGLARRRAAEADLIFRGRYRSRAKAGAEKIATATAIAAAPVAATVAVTTEPDTEGAVSSGLVVAGVVVLAALAVFAAWRLVVRSGGKLKAEA